MRIKCPSFNCARYKYSSRGLCSVCYKKAIAKPVKLCRYCHLKTYKGHDAHIRCIQELWIELEAMRHEMRAEFNNNRKILL